MQNIAKDIKDKFEIKEFLSEVELILLKQITINGNFNNNLYELFKETCSVDFKVLDDKFSIQEKSINHANSILVNYIQNYKDSKLKDLPNLAAREKHEEIFSYFLEYSKEEYDKEITIDPITLRPEFDYRKYKFLEFLLLKEQEGILKIEEINFQILPEKDPFFQLKQVAETSINLLYENWIIRATILNYPAGKTEIKSNTLPEDQQRVLMDLSAQVQEVEEKNKITQKQQELIKNIEVLKSQGKTILPIDNIIDIAGITARIKDPRKALKRKIRSAQNFKSIFEKIAPNFLGEYNSTQEGYTIL